MKNQIHNLWTAVQVSQPLGLLRKQVTVVLLIRGGVEDTRLEAKAKDPKKVRGQGQE